LKKNDHIYDRVYIDMNNNRNLADEKPIEGSCLRREDDYFYTSFPVIETTVQVGSETVPFPFSLYVRGRYDKKERDAEKICRLCTFDLRSAGHKAGEITVAGRKYGIGVIDGNANGKFGDRPIVQESRGAYKLTYYSRSDFFFLTKNGRVERHDPQPLCDFVFLEDRLFKVSVDAVGNAISFLPISTQSERTELSMAADRLTLFLPEKKEILIAYDCKNSLPIPATQCQVMNYYVTRKDWKKERWYLNASTSGYTKPVTLARPGGSVLAFGEPFRITAVVPEYSLSRNPEKASLRLEIKGRSNAEVKDLGCIDDKGQLLSVARAKSAMIKPPEYRILSRGGKLLSKGTLKYG